MLTVSAAKFQSVEELSAESNPIQVILFVAFFTSATLRCVITFFHEEVCLPTAAVALSCPSVPLSASELSLTEVRDKVPPLRRLDPGLMPLPDTACGLEWSSLVNAAKAYEGENEDNLRYQAKGQSLNV